MKNWLIRKLGAIPKDEADKIFSSVFWSGPVIREMKEENDSLWVRLPLEEVRVIERGEKVLDGLSILTDTQHIAAREKIRNY